MTDPITDKLVEQGTKSIGAVVDKLLGPTAEVMGKELEAWYTARRNLQKVARRASERTNLEDGGGVPPRVVAEVFEKAQWADDEFVAEYLSGVLASARTTDGANDSGVSWTALVGRMSADQIALHWVLYAAFQASMRDASATEFWPATLQQVVVDYGTLWTSLGWELNESILIRTMDAAYGLRREGLLADLTHGDGAYLQDEVTWTRGHAFDRNAAYLTFKVTGDGVGLLLHSVGEGKRWLAEISSQEVSQAVDQTEMLPKVQASSFVKDLPSPRNSDSQAPADG